MYTQLATVPRSERRRPASPLSRFHSWVGFICVFLFTRWVTAAATPDWPTEPLTLEAALTLALAQSPAILKSQQDLREAHGISIQQKAVYLPRLAANGAFNAQDTGRIDAVQFAPGQPPVRFQTDKSWNANLQLSQPIYGGGRLKSAQRASKLTEEAALAQHQTVVADALLEVRTTYLGVLLALEQINTQEASVRLLERELTDTQRRFEAGTVPRFNVLRAEVELANARPRLIKARNALRNTRNQLATLLGFQVSANLGTDIPLQTADHLAATAPALELGAALGRAQQQRSELLALSKSLRLRDEEIIQSRADYYPQLSVGAGYGVQSRVFGSPAPGLDEENHGWTAGAQMNWSVWDFGLTKGKVQAAEARRSRAELEREDVSRRIDLQVRTAYSGWTEAKDILEAQQKVIEQGEEALRLANARAEAGTGTQLDVLSAQTALTEARNTYSLALHDHSVAWARLERAMGEGVLVSR